MVAGSVYWKTDRQKRKEFDSVIAEQKAKEKNELWIKELEARDDEEKEMKAAREARRKIALDKRESGAKRVASTITEKVAPDVKGNESAPGAAEGKGEQGKSVLDSVGGLWKK